MTCNDDLSNPEAAPVLPFGLLYEDPAASLRLISVTAGSLADRDQVLSANGCSIVPGDADCIGCE
ncbi:hypothetical protein [Streptomyces sp. NBC_01602]|uniref:hypothetical protein n=1 Tax=Streptomyces sp. NBC_01602 TaxID=2975893 RepID=UPI00386C6AEE